MKKLYMPLLVACLLGVGCNAQRAGQFDRNMMLSDADDLISELNEDLDATHRARTKLLQKRENASAAKRAEIDVEIEQAEAHIADVEESLELSHKLRTKISEMRTKD